MAELANVPYFKTWLLFLVCSVVAGVLAGAVAGGVLGLAVYPLHLDPRTLKLAGGLAGAAASLVVSFFLFRLFVKRLIVSKLLAASDREMVST